MDQLLVVPDSRNGGGGSWIDQCPDGSLVSGLQAWVTPVNGTAVLGTDCVAGGMRFQCNGTYTPVGEIYEPVALVCSVADDFAPWDVGWRNNVQALSHQTYVGESYNVA
jgi:hypothetical protein